MSARAVRGPARATPAAPARPRAGAGVWPVAALLVLHVAVALFVSTRNSVTFDENFHLPAGIVALERADFGTSYAQPPLARELCGLAALAAGARVPGPESERVGDERRLGEAFMRLNADRFQRVYEAGRVVVTLMSAALGFLLWRTARAWYGPRAGLVALAAWVVAPEALAHGSLVGVDMPTALVMFGATIAGHAWLRTGHWRRWAVCAAWVAAAFLVRFSAVQLLPILAIVAALLAWRGKLASVPRTLAGIVLLALVGLAAVIAGYHAQGVGTPLGAIPGLFSQRFVALARHWPGLRTPLPVPYLRGLDYLSFLAQPGEKLHYFLGNAGFGADWRYFPVAIAVKWPLGLLGLVALRVVHRLRVRAPHAEREAALLVPVAVVMLTAMVTDLDYGVRYVLPVLPFLCVWAAGSAAPVPARGKVRAAAGRWAAVAIVLVALEAAESARGLPFPLAFFNLAAGGPGRGDRIVNDSNVDWGQGLLALRDDMRRLGIERVQLVSFGTTDPSVYGIHYVPFFNGRPDPGVPWFAVSSYFMAGLPARLVLSSGSTGTQQYDCRALLARDPVATPGNCMYLYRLH